MLTSLDKNAFILTKSHFLAEKKLVILDTFGDGEAALVSNDRLLFVDGGVTAVVDEVFAGRTGDCGANAAAGAAVGAKFLCFDFGDAEAVPSTHMFT